MKRCPACGRTFTNNTLVNCLNDGTVLVEDVPASPPYLGVPAAEASSFAETTPSFAETPPAAPPTEAASTVTYTNTPLSAIPELQSPQIQAALKDALDKAGMSAIPAFQTPQMQAALEKAFKKAEMSGLLDASSAHSTISVTTSTTTSQEGAPFFTTGTPPADLAANPVRRKRLPWVGWVMLFLLLLVAATGLWYIINTVKAGSKAPAPVESSPR